MSKAAKPHALQDNQRKAVAPDRTVWLSASAGTGKTQVLASRVLRLLLQPGVEPSQILCLTFTKAGATEMSGRINRDLAKWVRLPATDLAEELKAIGAEIGPEVQARARRLFAKVLDCPGGGLRIDTIHAFSQWLLAAFPAEANLTPGTRAMEERDRVILQRQVLADMLVEAESSPLGDPQLLDAIAELSLAIGPAKVEDWLLSAASETSVWFGPGSFQEPMRPNVLRLLGLAADADESDLAALCADDRFDTLSLRRCMDINRAWKAKTGQDNASIIADWLSCEPLVRSRGMDELHQVFHKKDGALRASSSQEKIDPDYPGHVARASEAIARVRDHLTLLNLAERLTKAFRLARAFAHAWEEAKKREGLIDFDDQIRLAADLLTDNANAQWIGYKLDRHFDHILVDEAQDTNAAQWRIILDGLAQEFFSGLGQRDGVLRTLFVVGDYKQAIFRFQGTSPEEFRKASDRVALAMDEGARNAAEMRADFSAQGLERLELDRSFRTGQPVLDFVNRAIEQIGFQRFGLDKPADEHKGDKRPGFVALWRPVGQVAASEPAGETQDWGDTDNDGDTDGGDSDAPQTWLSKPERQLADRIAKQVKTWLDQGFPLYKGKPRAAGPGDIMVLLRKRGDLASLIVARLHAHGVPVAGVDRLRLGAPLAVKDLMAALRFAAQPLDDLNLAALLVSPLIGWSQEQLLLHAYRPRKERLWNHLRRVSHADVANAMEHLGALLARADFEPPQALLHWLLVGPWQGRRRLVARLGREANDPIDELLNAAHSWSMSAVPSLAGFIAWFDAGEGELKREADNAQGQVRVMTVHGAKGLQAPIVILADATVNPEKAGQGEMIRLADPANPDRSMPIPGLRKHDKVGRLGEAAETIRKEADQEHWRLLYVAMTRAEEALFVGGALGLKQKEPVESSWYAQLQLLFGAQDWRKEVPIWGDQLEWGAAPQMGAKAEEGSSVEAEPSRPEWLDAPAGPEPRPPRPLAPSALGEDSGVDPPHPATPGAAAAARRGVLIHRLLERLPDLPPGERAAAAERWLSRNAAGLDAAERAEIAGCASAVLTEPDWADLFGPESLAEAPIAALVGTSMVAGTIDRLLIGKDRIRLIDFKSARRPPADIADVPRAVLRQMGAYAAALESAFPGRQIDAALLYTQTPVLLAIPAAMLDALKQELQGAQ